MDFSFTEEQQAVSDLARQVLTDQVSQERLKEVEAGQVGIDRRTWEELAKTNKTPGSLEEALVALEDDHAFLTKGDVFTEDMIEAWISWKREKEIDPMRLRPHPYEFVVGAAKARIARACFSTPPMALSARSLMPAYFSPANSGCLPFHSEKCVCIPEPLSSNTGLGIRVAVFPWRRATFLTMYLYHIIWSPIFTSSWNFMSISHWPAVATSW